MNYSKDFVFYLLPAGEIFSKYMKSFKSIEDIPKFTRKDFEQIVDIALQNRVIKEGNPYAGEEELRQLIPTDLKTKNSIFTKKSTEYVISKLGPIYSSHMGGTLLSELYMYDYLCLLKKEGEKRNNRFVTDEELSKQEEQIQSTIRTNNYPITELKKRK